MSAGRVLLRAMGRRLPQTDGTLRVAGLSEPATVRRDRFGIAHVSARSDRDASFALGFCHGQDRSFQLENLLRAGRGTLSELVGEQALALDRFSRRAGFARSARAQLEALPERERDALAAYAAGVNAARVRRPHELALLRRDLTPWEPVDVLGVLALVAFGLAGNWEMEIGRLRVLERDGPEALRAVDPAYPEWMTVTAPPGRAAGAAADRLAEDVSALASLVGAGGSNNWALAGSRAATGRPLVANDPHLSPTLPPFWYLANLRTPEWQVAGASVVGAPGVAVGHNDRVAWGVTNSGADVVDLYLEDDLEGAEVVEERIDVRDGEPVVERVALTPRGPVVAEPGEPGGPALSMRAAFLEEVSLAAVLAAPRARTWAQLRDHFARWPAAPLNVVGADADGTIGWKVSGRVPRREGASGLMPQPAAAPPWAGWVPAEEMPGAENPDAGFLTTANNKPVADGEGPWIGADWMDGYRVQRVTEALGERDDWDVESALALQRDVRSLPWREMRDALLSAPRDEPRARRALELLAEWDGEMAADSPAATVFALTVAELARRAAAAKAPGSVEWALGRGSSPMVAHTYVGLRQTGHVAGLLRTRPDGWFAGGWDAEVASALAAAVERLERWRGADPAGWAWGSVRPLVLRHPFGGRPLFEHVFNLGPIPWGGDTNTVAQASTPPLEPVRDPLYVGTLRIAMDVGEWERTRVSLAGGQSGNPLSPHYADLFAHWRRGEAVPLAFGEEAVAAATVATLRLDPVAA